MPDGSSVGGDALAFQIRHGAEGRILRHQDRQPVLAITVGGDGLDRHARRRREGEGRIADPARIDRPRIERFEQRGRRRELAPFEAIGQTVEHTGRLHQGARIAALVADAQNVLRPRDTGRQEGQDGKDKGTHQAASPRDPRCARAALKAGNNSRPY